jgi:hypothetical protein
MVAPVVLDLQAPACQPKDPSMILEATPQTKEAAEAITVDKVIVFGLNFHIIFGYVRADNLCFGTCADFKDLSLTKCTFFQTFN